MPAKTTPSPDASCKRLVDALKKAKLDRRLTTCDPKMRVYSGKRADTPTKAQLSKLFPPEYSAFVAKHGHPVLYLPSQLGGIAFLPPPAMCDVTGAMGAHALEGYADYASARRAREKGKYRWRFAMFAGFELSDVCGWCFGPDEDGEENDASFVWLVEDSLPREICGTFAQWLDVEVTRSVKALSKIKARELADLVAEVGDHEVHPRSLRYFC